MNGKPSRIFAYRKALFQRIQKACDENGDLVFDKADKPVFMRLPLTTVSDVAAKIMGNVETLEEAEKK